ncbi:TOMM system kinase/cyclase fusion protein [Haliangium ochraceum]|uniref:Serine/threonine protein kinase n=1 Tax=Haliangium ochraceum (strain DSM 14365 / JCM 11303 / SMP-2) TaxID=502025 RepID=D0LI65_HALO1|nr:TOMM system kinase/cyclase fusion protein [Haliangium ochraceum]ACY16444.1 serine/threonine protein kinase [Haliangium ochraceum DSM 14365]
MSYDSTIAVGTVFLDRYEIQEELSAGGFGIVYRAEQLATGQSVAIKCIRRFGPTPQDDDKRLMRFQREVRMCAKLHHPNIVRLMDSGRVDGSAFAVFEYVPGKNLAQVLAEEGRLSPSEAGHLMGQVLDALSCAHDAGIIHRDLKPANIMVVPTGARRNAMVLDFGIGGILHEVRELDDLTLTSTMDRMGTPAYSSPEQLRGRALTPKTDIYSWSLVLLECLTGTRAMDGNTIAEIMHHQLDDTPVPIPRALQGHPLDSLLRVASAKNPVNRQLSAHELLTRLEACPLAALDLSSEGDLAPQNSAEYSTLRVAVPDLERERRHGYSSDGSESFAWPESSGRAKSSDRARSGDAAADSPRERRQVTVVSCALSVFASDMNPLDLEEQEDRLAAELTRCRQLAEGFDCYVQSGSEQRVLMFFGYPRASAEDPRRAIQAALRIGQAFAGRSAELRSSHGIRTDVQIAVHTGMALVRGYGKDGALSGAAVREAMQLDAHAEANGVVVSAAAHALAARGFSFGDSRRVSIAGQAQAVEVFPVEEVLWEQTSPSVTVGAISAPLLGRDEEYARLRSLWARARDGAGQSVVILGDAGIGKSRLVRELSRSLDGKATHFVQSRCLPENCHIPFGPVSEMLQRYLRFRPTVSDEQRRQAIAELCERYELEVDLGLPLLSVLLDVPVIGAFEVQTLAPAKQRELTVRALLALVTALAAEQPTLLVFEDLQWADPSTLQLLEQLAGDAASVPLLLLFTARPDFDLRRIPGTLLELSRLSSVAAGEMVQRCAGGKLLPSDVTAEILRRTDGVPLFVEEMVRAVLDSGMLLEHDAHFSMKGSLSDLDIPISLRDLLMSRLDSLSDEAKAALQLGAVIGREFRSDELEAAGGYDALVLQRLTDELVDSGLLYCRRRLVGELFVFKHALVHDAAYDSMPRRTRRMYHGHIASQLEDSRHDVAGKRPELLARHHGGAGNISLALDYSRRAAIKALAVSANDEAIGHAKQAIAWAQDLPDATARAEAELSFHAIIAPALLGTRGNGDREFGQLLRRSLKLIARVGDSPLVLPTLWGFWLHRYVRAEFARALPLAENYLDRAERLGDLSTRTVGNAIMACNLFYLARFAEAQQTASKALALYEPEAHRHHMMTVGHDTKVAQLGIRSLCTWLQGYPEQAVADAESGLAWARDRDHPISTCFALFFLAHVRLWNGELQRAAAAAAELGQIAERHGLDHWILLGRVLHCGAMRDGATIRALLTRFDEASQLIGASHWRVLIADSEAEAGDYEAALAAIEDARAFAEGTGEYFLLAEIHRRRGEYLWRCGEAREQEAETCLRGAVAVAKKQGARMSRLLSTASLCRLYAQRLERDNADPSSDAPALHETLDALREQCAEIGEGHGVPVQAKARAVLDDLAHLL